MIIECTIMLHATDFEEGQYIAMHYRLLTYFSLPIFIYIHNGICALNKAKSTIVLMRAIFDAAVRLSL